jgi:hypothetical protein
MADYGRIKKCSKLSEGVNLWRFKFGQIHKDLILEELVMGEWLGQISYILGIIGNFILFIILFIPRIERKKSNIILAVGFFIMLIVHQVLIYGFKMSITNAGMISMSIPSLLLCYYKFYYRLCHCTLKQKGNTGR